MITIVEVITVAVTRHCCQRLSHYHCQHIIIITITVAVNRQCCHVSHLNPCLGEEGARSKDENEVEDSVEGVLSDLGEGEGGGDIVGKSRNRDGVSCV